MEYKIQTWKDLGRTSGWKPKKNPLIVETAGFVPLEVKIKRLEENGIRLQFERDMSLTSAQIRELYLHPDFEINEYDDLEEVEAKLAARQEYVRQLLAKQTNSSSVVDKPGAEAVVEPASKGKPDSSTDSAQELSSDRTLNK